MRQRVYRFDAAPRAYGAATVAIRIADMYPMQVPTVAELRARWGMSRATAYRWIRILKYARGIS